MPYFLVKGNPVHEVLEQYSQDRKKQVKEAIKVTKELGAKEYYLSMERGLLALQFHPNSKIDSTVWCRFSKKHPRYAVRPKKVKAASEVRELMKSVPKVSMKPINEALKFQFYMNEKEGRACSHPGINKVKDSWFIHMSEWVLEKYEPVKCIKEITVKEYLKLGGNRVLPIYGERFI